MSFYIHRNRAISRRSFLRGAGVALSLPLLDAMTPAFAHANQSVVPRRFLAINFGLGFHAPFLFPKESGTDYTLTPYLEPLKDHRKDLTVFSGLSHPDQSGNNGHASELTILTSARRPGLPGFRNTISIDQQIAAHLGTQTRYSSLVLAMKNDSISWSANGINIPAENSPANLFKMLFVNGTPAEVKSKMKELRRGKSILDTIHGEAKKLNRNLGPEDRQKLEDYLTAVRGVEQAMQESEAWVNKPKPKVEIDPPKDIANQRDTIAKQRLMYEMIALAFRTDSTRTITFKVNGLNQVPVVDGVSQDWHNLSHHGQDPSKISELKLIELAEIREFATFLGKLKTAKESNGSLLDRTAVLFTSNLGNASSHDWHNLPIIVAGGGFKHGSHIQAGNAQDNKPLCNLFVSLAQWMGLELNQFGSSTSSSVRDFDLKS